MQSLIQDGSEGRYEQMYLALLDYRFERVSFLELLDKWEVILNIKSSSCNQDEEAENVMDLAS